MAHGKPVVATEVGGIPEVVEHGTTGLLVPPGDSAELASAVIRIAGDPALRNAMGQAGLRRYQDRFSAGVMARRTIAMYEHVVAGWRTANPDRWNTAPEQWHRGSDTSVVWDPEARRTVLLVGGGAARTAVYGPYMQLQPGSWRVEFLLRVPESPSGDVDLGSVDVFSGGHGFLKSRPVRSSDFTHAAACLDIFFDVPPAPPVDYEFRVQTAGTAAFFVTHIRVRRWPAAPVSLSNADPAIDDCGGDPPAVNAIEASAAAVPAGRTG
jgi:hypothetical protein